MISNWIFDSFEREFYIWHKKNIDNVHDMMQGGQQKIMDDLRDFISLILLFTLDDLQEHTIFQSRHYLRNSVEYNVENLLNIFHKVTNIRISFQYDVVEYKNEINLEFRTQNFMGGSKFLSTTIQFN